MTKKKDEEIKGKLVCLNECVSPGFGHWMPGDEILDPFLIERFKENPYFKYEEK